MALTGPLTNALTGQLTSALTGVRSFAQSFLTSVGNFVFSRTGDQTFDDFEGLVKTVPTDQSAHIGARMVENLADPDMTSWNEGGTTTVSVDVDGFLIESLQSAEADGLKFTSTDPSFEEATTRVSLKAVNGADVGKTIKIIFKRNSGTSGTSNLIHTLTEEFETVSIVAHQFDTADVGFRYVIAADTATQCIAKEPQVEDVTGQANQNPSEFVDGVRFFGDTNGNIVDSNGVVSDASLLRNLSFDSARDTTQGRMESLCYNIDEDHVIVANDSTDSLWIYDRSTIDTDSEIQLITQAQFAEFAFPGNPTEGNKYAREIELVSYNRDDGHLYVINNHNSGTDEAGIYKLLWGGSSYDFVDFVPLPSYLTFNPQCLTILHDGTFLVGDVASLLGSLDIFEYTPNFTTGGSYSSLLATFSFTGRGYGLSNNGVDVVCVSYEGDGTDGGTTARQISKIDWPSKVQYVTYLIQDTGQVLIKPRAIEYINGELWIGENPTTFISDSITIYDETATEFPFNGLLLEDGSTNLLLESENFDDAVWTKGGTTTINANVATAPDGTMTGDRINFDGTTGEDLLQNITQGAIDGRIYTGTIWFKGEGSDIGKDVRLKLKRRSGGIDMSSNVTVTLTAEWQRVSVVFIGMESNTDVRFVVQQPGSNDADTALIWGAQLEENAFASSYIKTEAGSAIRSDTSLTNSWNFPANGISGQIKVRPQFDSVDNTGAGDGPRILSFSDGTANNRLELHYDGTPGNDRILLMKRVDGSGNDAETSTNDLLYTRGDLINIRFRASLADGLSLWVDDVPKKSNGSQTEDWTTLMDTVNIAANYQAGDPSNETVEYIQVWNEAKSDGFLAGLT